ncbi:MAG: hypothetical protein IT370_25160 [Deltaproteobacteria bacterium]|nr:hypothetical protein [Deltaproteobacteria bacterium]
MTRTGWVGLVLLCGLSGCAPKRYYALEYQLDARALNVEGVRFPPAEARTLLRRATVVAFAPPDECAESSGSEVSLVRARCGEVMAGLEEAAGAAGFKVVSWQALRGSEPPLVYARRQKVEVLFEVNRMGIERESTDVQGVGHMQFLSVDADGDATPVSVGEAVRQRCSALVAEGVGGSAGVLLDVKMVSVKDGLTLWNYRWLFSALEVGGQASRIYFKAGRAQSSGKKVMMIAGAALAGSGAVLLAAGIPIENDSLIGGGAVGLVGGGALLFLGRPGVQSASQVLCRKAPVADPFRSEGLGAPPGADSDSGEIRFTRQGSASAEGRVRPIARLAAREFVELIAALREVGGKPPARPSRPARKSQSSGCALMQSWLEQGTPGLTQADVARHCK